MNYSGKTLPGVLIAGGLALALMTSACDRESGHFPTLDLAPGRALAMPLVDPAWNVDAAGPELRDSRPPAATDRPGMIMLDDRWIDLRPLDNLSPLRLACGLVYFGA